jgi:hypothetical protein
MNEVILGIGVAAIVLYAALVELKGTLENLRKLSGDIGAVTEDVKQMFDHRSEGGKEHSGLYDQLRVIGQDFLRFCPSLI